MTTVLIADDQALIRQAVSGILDLDGISVVGHAADGREAVALAAELTPDIVLMDIRMPELDGIEATARICADERLSGTRVLILTTFEEDDYVLSALRAGASGFIGKGAEPDEIVRAVQAVHAGESLLSPAATRSLIQRFVATEPVSPHGARRRASALACLTERETEVLGLVGQGLSNVEIAERLFISPHTAKTHVNRMMSKVHAHDRAQLVVLAYETGVIAPGE